MRASVWKKTTFGNIGTLAMCKRVFQYETKQEGEIPFYKIGTFGSEPDAYISKELFDDYKKQFSYPNKGDILISASGTIGRTVIFDGKPSYFQDSNIMWLAHNESKILNRYLFHLYKTITWNLEGSTIKRLYTDNFKKIEVIFPQDINEQKRISTILSTCDTVIQNTQKTIEKYKAVKQGMMQDLFTRGLTKDGKLRPSFEEAPELYKESELGMIPKEWEVKELGECAEINSSHLSIPNEFIYIDLESVIDGKLVIEKIMNKQNAPSRAQRVVSMKDILYQTVRPYQKNNLYFEFESKYKYVASTGYAQIKTDECSKYLFYFLHNDDFIAEVLTRCTGTSYPAIAPKELENVKVKIPLDSTEQIEIAKRLSAIDLTIQKEEAILSKYKNIKAGLMARLLIPPADAEIIDETGV